MPERCAAVSAPMASSNCPSGLVSPIVYVPSVSAWARKTTIKCEASGASAIRSPTVPICTMVSRDRLRPRMARVFSCPGSIVDGATVISAGAVGDDGSGLVRVLPAGSVPAGGSAVELGDALGDDFAVGLGFGFTVVVAEAVGVGEAVAVGEGRAACAGVASAQAKASSPTTARACSRPNIRVQRRTRVFPAGVR